MVGLLYIAIGLLNGLFALFELLFFGAVSISVYLGVNSVITSAWLWLAVALIVPSVVMGIALMSFRPWARGIGIVFSVFLMLAVPLGTAVALYGLWVLFAEETDMLFTRRFGQYTIGRRQ